MRVLLVEDNPGDARLVREALTETLPGADLELVHVQRLEEALARLDAVTFDVVLLDLSLPDSQGLDTLRRLRRHESDVGIVVLTGLNDEALAVQAVHEGAQDYLYKGVEGPLLVRSLRYAVERQRMVIALSEQSLIDDLTGLYNRRGFVTLATRRLAEARRRSERILLTFIDLDGMKAINDTHGHQAGDAALREAAAVLRGSFRESDILGRIGGDEFAVVTADDGGANGQEIDSRLQAGIERHNAEAERPYQLAMSVGCVVDDPFDSSTATELLDRADRLMYERKRQRKRTVVLL